VSNFNTWLGGIYKAFPGGEADGHFLEISRSQLEQIWQGDFETAWCMARPLAA
jgi:hypothetical protein